MELDDFICFRIILEVLVCIGWKKKTLEGIAGYKAFGDSAMSYHLMNLGGDRVNGEEEKTYLRTILRTRTYRGL